jgi:hypothetical protein
MSESNLPEWEQSTVAIAEHGLFKADLPAWRTWFLCQLLQLIKHNRKVFVVSRKFSDDGGKLTVELFVRFQYLPQSDKGSHNGDIDFDRLFTVQHARQHCHTLFRKRIWQISSTTVPYV